MKTTHSLRSKGDYEKELRKLIDRIEENIENLSSYQRSKADEAKQEFIDNLNRLKLIHFKLCKHMKLVEETSTKAWPQIREQSEKLFKEGKEELMRVSETVRK